MNHSNDTAKPRQCFWIPVCQDDPHGFVPSLVTENEPGHSPMVGQGEYASPWYWGKTLEKAKETCNRVNKDRFGISEKTALRIVASSMRDSDIK